MVKGPFIIIVFPPCPPLSDPATREPISSRLLSFWHFYQQHAAGPCRSPLSIRDLLAWVSFINSSGPLIGHLAAYAHGAYLTLLDGLGLGVGLPAGAAQGLRAACQAFLRGQLPAELELHAQLAAGSMGVAQEMEERGMLGGVGGVGRG